MTGRFVIFLAGLLLVVFAAVQAQAAVNNEKRVALVIGNSSYTHAITLPNPTSDARMMSAVLRDAGFEVIEGLDLDKAGMSSALDRFTEISYDAAVALIYYAGHGIQVDGKNFLIPVDANLTSPAHLKTRTVQVEELLAALPPDPAVGVIILDACRDNPLARTLAAALPATRSATLGSGLAPVQATATGTGTGGILIAYATDPGSIALDGKGANSPYTTALAKYIATPGMEIQSALTKVRGDVTQMTVGRQRPWHNASLGREVFLGGQAPDDSAPAKIVLGEQPVQAAGAEPSSWEIEQRLWDEASKRNSVGHYEAYLEQFPNGRFARIASLNIDQLNQPQQMASVEAATTIPGSGSAIRTAVAVPEEVKQTPGTQATESAIGLDRQARVDVQLRLEALGFDLGGVDGSFGQRSRNAIGGWQRQLGILETTFLTSQQHMFLIVQTDPMMPAVRARHQSEQAVQRASVQKRQAQRPAKQRVQRSQKQADNGSRRQRRQSNSNFDPAGAAFFGGLIGGAIGGALGR